MSSLSISPPRATSQLSAINHHRRMVRFECLRETIMTLTEENSVDLGPAVVEPLCFNATLARRDGNLTILLSLVVPDLSPYTMVKLIGEVGISANEYEMRHCSYVEQVVDPPGAAFDGISLGNCDAILRQDPHSEILFFDLNLTDVSLLSDRSEGVSHLSRALHHPDFIVRRLKMQNVTLIRQNYTLETSLADVLAELALRPEIVEVAPAAVAPPATPSIAIPVVPAALIAAAPAVAPIPPAASVIARVSTPIPAKRSTQLPSLSSGSIESLSAMTTAASLNSGSPRSLSSSLPPRSAREMIAAREMHMASAATNASALSMSTPLTSPRARVTTVGDVVATLKNIIKRGNPIELREISRELSIVVELAKEGLEEAEQCTICSDRVAVAMLIPCGHVCSCWECSNRLGDSCPICRATVGSRRKIHPKEAGYRQAQFRRMNKASKKVAK
jgi:hypothetical protein